MAAVSDNSAEIGNLQNQLNSTNRSFENTKTERQNMEQTLATQASQLSALQTQLSSAKAAYETETNHLNTLRERFATQTADIQKAREELIRAESDLSGVRVEKAEIEGSIMRDKEEVRDLQRKMKEVGDEIEQAKSAIEKAKKETKHQKGLLAIARKQLATREAERAKIAKELEDAQFEAQNAMKEREAAEEELSKEPVVPLSNGAASPTPSTFALPPRTDTPSFAAAQPLPASPASTTPLSLTSPSGSGKSNNPFERLTKSTGSRPASPFSAPSLDLFTVPTPQTEGVPSPNDVIGQAVNSAPLSTSPLTNVSDVFAAEAPTEPPRVASPFMHVMEPSASTTIPSTTEPAATDDDDPFGLNDGEGKQDSITTIATTEEKGEVPSQLEATIPPVTTEQEKSSPVVDSKPSVPEGKKPEPISSPSFDTHFPAIGGPIPGGFPGLDEHTDLDSKLVEKEHDESDSDSDDEGVFHDANARLSLEKEGKQAFDTQTNGKPTGSSNAFDDAFGLGGSSPVPQAEVEAASAAAPSSDLFTAFTPTPVQPATNGAALEKVSAPFDNSPATAAAPVPATGAALSAFDEAFGKISASNSTSAPQFKLDSAFDDDFDFTAAKAAEPAATFPPVASTSAQPIANGSTETPKAAAAPEFTQTFNMSPVQNGSIATQTTTNTKPLSFDDAFGSVSSRLSSVPSAGDHGISFEEAFGGKSLSFAELGNGATAPSNGQPAGDKEAASSVTPFPVQSPPTSPGLPATTPASPSTVRSVRTSSPPPRVSSPKPRVSTGSSNESGPSTKSPPQRHSKLSVSNTIFVFYNGSRPLTHQHHRFVCLLEEKTRRNQSMNPHPCLRHNSWHQSGSQRGW